MGISFGRGALAAVSMGSSEVLRAGSSGGMNPFSAALTGIPYIGEGFAQQQSQNFNAAQASAKNAFEQASAEKQMAFQKEMASTQHQREVADLRAAGLNPMLSGMGGSGAAAPSGAAASGTAASSTPHSGASSSAGMLQKIFTRDRDVAEAQIAKTKQDTAVGKVQEKVAEEQIELTKASAQSQRNEAQLKKYAIPGAKVQSDFQSQWGKQKIETDAVMDIINKGANSAGSIFDLINPLRRIPKRQNAPQRQGTIREHYDSRGEHSGSTHEQYKY